MINEYLFLSDKYKSDIKALKFDGVTFEINEIEKTELWTVRCFVANNGEDGAKILSDVHDRITAFEPKVLSCESSQYFNNKLYPMINEFERKLRKLIYLADAISNKDSKNIGELEKQDFGEIFDLLFIDENFIKTLKIRVNAPKNSVYEGKERYSKSEITKFINDTVENTLWDKIFGADDVPTLKKSYRDIQTYRNDVMHAHNIGKKTYGKIRYLFNKVNSEIDVAIGRRMNDNIKENLTPEVSASISSALQNLPDAMSNIAKTIQFFYSPKYIETIDSIKRAFQNSLMDLYNSAEYNGLNNPLSELQDIVNQSETMAMKDFSRRLNESRALYSVPEINKDYQINSNKQDNTSVETKSSEKDDNSNGKK